MKTNNQKNASHKKAASAKSTGIRIQSKNVKVAISGTAAKKRKPRHAPALPRPTRPQPQQQQQNNPPGQPAAPAPAPTLAPAPTSPPNQPPPPVVVPPVSQPPPPIAPVTPAPVVVIPWWKKSWTYVRTGMDSTLMKILGIVILVLLLGWLGLIAYNKVHARTLPVAIIPVAPALPVPSQPLDLGTPLIPNQPTTPAAVAQAPVTNPAAALATFISGMPPGTALININNSPIISPTIVGRDMGNEFGGGQNRDDYENGQTVPNAEGKVQLETITEITERHEILPGATCIFNVVPGYYAFVPSPENPMSNLHVTIPSYGHIIVQSRGHNTEHFVIKCTRLRNK